MTLNELAESAARCSTRMADAMMLAVVDAILHGSSFGFECE